MSTSNTKLGRITRLINKFKKWNEANIYIRIWTEDANGKNELPLFLTEKEYNNALKRTQRNKEDWGKRGFFTDLFD